VATAARAFRVGLVREADTGLRGERSQETDGREAGTSAVRSSGTIVRRRRRIPSSLRPHVKTVRLPCVTRRPCCASPAVLARERTVVRAVSYSTLSMQAADLPIVLTPGNDPRARPPITHCDLGRSVVTSRRNKDFIRFQG